MEPVGPDTAKILDALARLNEERREAVTGIKQELRDIRTDLKGHMRDEASLIGSLVNRIANMEGKVTMLLAVLPLGAAVVAIIAFIRGGP